MGRPLRIESADAVYHVTSRSNGREVDSPLSRAVHGLVPGADAFVAKTRRMLEDRADEAELPAPAA